MIIFISILSQFILFYFYLFYFIFMISLVLIDSHSLYDAMFCCWCVDNVFYKYVIKLRNVIFDFYKNSVFCRFALSDSIFHILLFIFISLLATNGCLTRNILRLWYVTIHGWSSSKSHASSAFCYKTSSYYWRYIYSPRSSWLNCL